MNATGLEAPQRLANAEVVPSAPVDELPVDFGKRFIADELTPLFYSPAFASLTPSVRQRYNQLHALYFNEQVTFFEQEMLSPALLALSRGPLPSCLAADVRTFFAEEQRHTARFRGLNARCAPGLYAASPYRFVRMPRPLMKMVTAVAAHPFRFPLFIWLALLQEERSLHYSKVCLSCADELEPSFVATHRAHLADEVGHVGWDEELLDWLWPRTGPVTRQLNARILTWMLGEYFLLPKRSAIGVIEHLGSEFPDLDVRSLIAATRALKDNRNYVESLYSREATPRAFARFDSLPEFALLGRTLPGYRPPRFPL
jgi:hypothetical protein